MKRMKKGLLYILMSLTVVCFHACKDTDVSDGWEETSGDNWEYLSGIYRGKMKVEIENVPVDTIYQQAYITTDDRNRMNLEIRSIIIDDNISLSNITFRNAHFRESESGVEIWGESLQNAGIMENARAILNGVIKNGTMEIVLKVESNTSKPVRMAFNALKVDKVPSDDVSIKKMTLEHPWIVSQPSIGGNMISFYMTDTIKLTDTTEMWIKPVFELSDEQATISNRDSTLNFANRKKPITYTVWAADSIHRQIYSVRLLQGSVLKYDFGLWKNLYGWEDPTGMWATNNGLFAALKERGEYEGGFPVSRTKGYDVGDFGVRMETVMAGLDTNSHVYAGSFFQGSFDRSMKAPLYGPEYGVSFKGKPSKVKGYYKYIPGPDIYDGYLKMADTLKVADTCCIRAILYEAATQDVTLDTVDYMNDPKVVAIADFGSSGGKMQKNYTEFNIYFTYIKGYFVTKRYKIAFICSSSRDADKKRGAPKSELSICGLEVLYSNN